MKTKQNVYVICDYVGANGVPGLPWACASCACEVFLSKSTAEATKGHPFQCFCFACTPKIVGDAIAPVIVQELTKTQKKELASKGYSPDEAIFRFKNFINMHQRSK